MYTQLNSSVIRRDADGVQIPVDPDNQDYAEYLALVEAGTIPPAIPAVVNALVPTIIYKWQAIYELNKRGLWQVVQDYINAADTPWEAKIAWDNIHELDRDNPLIAAFAAKMGWTPQFLDDFFTAASTWQIK